MSEQATNAIEAVFEVEGLNHKLHLLHLEGEEGVSIPFRFGLVLAARSSDLAFKDVVGKPGQVTLNRDGTLRYIHGMVSHFQQRESGRTHTIYHATLVPRVYRLLHRQDCRIFQNMSIKEIIAKVLDAAQIDYKFQVAGGPMPARRGYCVQYRESDWDFVCRLLEEEGFFYFFEHSMGKHLLQMGNGYQVHPDIAGEAKVPFKAPTTTSASEEHVFRFYYGEGVQSGKVTLADFDFQKPSLALQESKAGSQDTELEFYDYPGLYQETRRGKELAGLRLDEHQAQRQQGEGQSDCIRFGAGQTFTLDGCTRSALAGSKFVLTRVYHLAEKAAEDLEAGLLDSRVTYTNDFGCILRDVPFRPPRSTRKPHVQGVQTAIVTGPPGEEIYTDEHGRVMVLFHWDRLGRPSKQSSCWVRVSQLWAGQGWGAIWIPRVGQEVIVDFEEGDPDRPIIIGRVYHAQNVPPYTLPDNKTRSAIKSSSSPGGAGFNEISFEDKKGSEEIYVHAHKDQIEEVGNDLTTTIKNNHKQTVEKGDQTLTVSKGIRTREVTKGNDKLTVGGNRDVTVKRNASEKVTQKKTIEAQEIQIKANTKLTITVGAAKVTITADGKVAVNGTVLEAKGSMATIKASGPINLKGAVVKEN